METSEFDIYSDLLDPEPISNPNPYYGITMINTSSDQQSNCSDSECDLKIAFESTQGDLSLEKVDPITSDPTSELTDRTFNNVAHNITVDDELYVDFIQEKEDNRLKDIEKKLKEENTNLLKTVKELLYENQHLGNQVTILKNNISALFKTADNEIKRKNAEIHELRQRLDGVLFRRQQRNFTNNYHNSETTPKRQDYGPLTPPSSTERPRQSFFQPRNIYPSNEVITEPQQLPETNTSLSNQSEDSTILNEQTSLVSESENSVERSLKTETLWVTSKYLLRDGNNSYEKKNLGKKGIHRLGGGEEKPKDETRLLSYNLWKRKREPPIKPPIVLPNTNCSVNEDDKIIKRSNTEDTNEMVLKDKTNVKNPVKEENTETEKDNLQNSKLRERDNRVIEQSDSKENTRNEQTGKRKRDRSLEESPKKKPKLNCSPRKLIPPTLQRGFKIPKISKDLAKKTANCSKDSTIKEGPIPVVEKVPLSQESSNQEQCKGFKEKRRRLSNENAQNENPRFSNAKEKVKQLGKDEPVDKMLEKDKVDKMPEKDKVDKMLEKDKVDKMLEKDKVDKMLEKDKVDKMLEKDKVDKMLKKDKVDKMLEKDKVDKMLEKYEPVENMLEKNEPVENMLEKNEPVEKMLEKNEPVEKMLEKNEPVEKMLEKNEPVEKMLEKNEPVEKMLKKNEPVEKMLLMNKPVEMMLEKNEPVEMKARKDNPVENISKKDNTVENISKKDNTVEKIPEKDNMVEKISKKDNTVEKIPEKDNTVEKISKKDNTVEKISKKDNTVEKIPEKDNMVEKKAGKDNKVVKIKEEGNMVEKKAEKNNKVENKREKANTFPKDDSKMNVKTTLNKRNIDRTTSSKKPSESKYSSERGKNSKSSERSSKSEEKNGSSSSKRTSCDLEPKSNTLEKSRPKLNEQSKHIQQNREPKGGKKPMETSGKASSIKVDFGKSTEAIPKEKDFSSHRNRNGDILHERSKDSKKNSIPKRGSFDSAKYISRSKDSNSYSMISLKDKSGNEYKTSSRTQNKSSSEKTSRNATIERTKNRRDFRRTSKLSEETLKHSSFAREKRDNFKNQCLNKTNTLDMIEQISNTTKPKTKLENVSYNTGVLYPNNLNKLNITLPNPGEILDDNNYQENEREEGEILSDSDDDYFTF